MDLSADQQVLTLSWDDGQKTQVTARALRQGCPCAECVDEWTHQRRLDPEQVPLDLRILGVARGVPLAEMRRLLPFLWVGFWLNAASGLLLLAGYPTKALTNPVFYLKLILIAVAMTLVVRISRHAADYANATSDFPAPLRRLAITSLVCWAGAITAGRLLAYTYSRLSQSF